MSDISPIGRGSVGPLHHQPHVNGSANRNGAVSTANGTVRSSMTYRDSVELSEHAKFMDRLRQLPEVRMDRVEAAREAIENGVYESPEKLDIAVSRMLEDLF